MELETLNKICPNCGRDDKWEIILDEIVNIDQDSRGRVRQFDRNIQAVCKTVIPSDWGDTNCDLEIEFTMACENS